LVLIYIGQEEGSDEFENRETKIANKYSWGLEVGEVLHSPIVGLGVGLLSPSKRPVESQWKDWKWSPLRRTLQWEALGKSIQIKQDSNNKDQRIRQNVFMSPDKTERQ
jgi:hypothetical protein